MHKKYAGKGLVILAISDEPMSKVSPFVKKNKMNYIVGVDGKKTQQAYKVKGYPTYFVVNGEGKIIYEGHDGEEAEVHVKKALKELKPGSSGFWEKAGQADLDAAEALAKNGKYDKALKAYEKAAKSYKGSKIGDAATKAAAKLKSDPEIGAKIREAEAGKKCKGWLQFARDAAKNGDNDRARGYYERIIKEFPESSFAKTAREEMESLSG